MPFFLRNGHAIVEGIGDEVKEYNQISPGIGFLVVPSISIPTKESFENLKKPLQNTHTSKTWSYPSYDVLESLKKGDWGHLVGVLKNDFEDYAFKKHPILGDLKEDLYEFGCLYASMTGTGSSMYGFCSHSGVLEDTVERIQSKYDSFTIVRFSF